MTQITPEHQMEAAAHSVTAKLEAFHESLTPDEQRVLSLALRHAEAGEGETTEDTAGYLMPWFGGMQEDWGKAIEEARKELEKARRP